MAEEYDGWVVKNKYSALLFWTFKETRNEVIAKVGDWEERKKLGDIIVRAKLVEVG